MENKGKLWMQVLELQQLVKRLISGQSNIENQAHSLNGYQVMLVGSK